MKKITPISKNMYDNLQQRMKRHGELTIYGYDDNVAVVVLTAKELELLLNAAKVK